MTAKTIQTRVIKKYQTRRLYNTATGKYTTLESLAAMAREGIDFQVLDAKTGEDITRSTLIHIVLEKESKQGQNLLPIIFLRELIRFYGDTMGMSVRYFLEISMNSLTSFRKAFPQQMCDQGDPPTSTLNERKH